MNSSYQNIKEPNIRSQIIFELISWFGRHFLIWRSKISSLNKPLLVDLGAGANFTKNWIHVDFYQIRLKFWNIYKYQRPEIQTDLRYPLNCPSNSVDGVYSGHTLEHLYPQHAYQLLGEIFRILKPECWLRINVPDLKILVDFYTGKVSIPEFEYRYKAEAIANYTQSWGHHSVWDEELLNDALKINGFINIRKVEFGQEGTDKRLIKEEKIRKFETIVMEAQKP